MTINEYFDKVICINLARRTDRWAHVQAECEKHGLELERFEGVNLGEHMGNDGCTASHAGVLRLIIENKWPRTLVLEDDFQFRFEDSQDQFAKMLPEVPDDWFLFYLGGHYADKPQKRISPHVVKMNRMKTTSSYGVTLEAAARMLPDIQGCGPIDELYGWYQENFPCYILQPRLVVQREGWSDIQRANLAYEGCMTDPNHEAMV